MPLETLARVVEGHKNDPNYELSWNSLSELLKIDHPFHDLVTDIIDRFSEYDKECLRASLGYHDAFTKEYKLSRNQWIKTAMTLKGRELNPDEMIMVANKHRIYFAVTHPRKMNIHAHNVYEERVVTDFLEQIKEDLGEARCRELGYCFDEAARPISPEEERLLEQKIYN